MSLDTETFEKWMGKLMERFDHNEQLLSSLTGKEIKKSLNAKQCHPEAKGCHLPRYPLRYGLLPLNSS